MSRKKKSEIVEEITPMKDGDMNEPIIDTTEEVTEKIEPVVEKVKEEVKEEVKPVAKAEPKKEPVFKKIVCPASAINVRDGAEGNILFTIKNYSKVMVEDEADGWTKIVGYVKSELVHSL